MKNVPQQLTLPSVKHLHLSRKVHLYRRSEDSRFWVKSPKLCIKWCHLHLKTCFFWFRTFVFFLTAKKWVSQRHSCTKKHEKTLKLSVLFCFVACTFLLQLVKTNVFQKDIYLPLFVSEGIELLFLALSTASWCKCKTNLNVMASRVPRKQKVVQHYDL